MDACRFDPVDAANGAGKLTFERAQMIDVLDETGGAERIGLVEDFVADAAAFWAGRIQRASFATGRPCL